MHTFLRTQCVIVGAKSNLDRGQQMEVNEKAQFGLLAGRQISLFVMLVFVVSTFSGEVKSKVNQSWEQRIYDIEYDPHI